VILKSRGRTVPCRIEADALMAGSFAGRASIRPRVRIGFGKIRSIELLAPEAAVLPAGQPLVESCLLAFRQQT
jgi:hypothetical protein